MRLLCLYVYTYCSDSMPSYVCVVVALRSSRWQYGPANDMFKLVFNKKKMIHFALREDLIMYFYAFTKIAS